MHYVTFGKHNRDVLIRAYIADTVCSYNVINLKAALTVLFKLIVNYISDI
jgi:hypothetical protein